jgi:6-phosphogluconate dehydrogenase
MENKSCSIGMVGLGVMGRNLLLNMADHGYTVAGYDKDLVKVASLKDESAAHSVHAAGNIETFISLLQTPRTIMLLVPAGAPVDYVIKDLVPHLEKGDLIIDAGNSHFTDTDRRIQELSAQGLYFLGVGVSGGEEGARHGPSIMPGGDKQAYARVSKLLEAVAAKVDNQPCVTYLGANACGHYVKMVHNGIEYAIMQLIAETYALMKQSLEFNNDQLHAVYKQWNQGELGGYLIEITSHIFAKNDDKTNKHLIDEIQGIAKQNGTGMWTSQSAMELQVPVPTIDISVVMRDLSVLVQQREQANHLYKPTPQKMSKDHTNILEQLHDALYAAIFIAYAQGMALLVTASEKYNYQLDLEAVARIWRGGCIIRSRMLDDISAAFHAERNLSNLLLDANCSAKMKLHMTAFRQVVSHAAMAGIAMPAMMTSLSYIDAYCSAWLPANLIQAQRDYFGSHTYARNDMSGTFHTEWEQQTT